MKSAYAGPGKTGGRWFGASLGRVDRSHAVGHDAGHRFGQWIGTRRVTNTSVSSIGEFSMPRIGLYLMLLGPLLIAGCRRSSAPAAQKSPDGSMTLTTAVNQSDVDPTRYLCVIVDIADERGRTLYHEVTPASDTMRWSVRWVSDREILLKSSDVGVYHIRRRPNGVWTSGFDSNPATGPTTAPVDTSVRLPTRSP